MLAVSKHVPCILVVFTQTGYKFFHRLLTPYTEVIYSGLKTFLAYGLLIIAGLEYFSRLTDFEKSGISNFKQFLQLVSFKQLKKYY